MVFVYLNKYKHRKGWVKRHKPVTQSFSIINYYVLYITVWAMLLCDCQLTPASPHTCEKICCIMMLWWLHHWVMEFSSSNITLGDHCHTCSLSLPNISSASTWLCTLYSDIYLEKGLLLCILFWKRQTYQ